MNRVALVLSRWRPGRLWIGAAALLAACFAQEVKLLGPGGTPGGGDPGGGPHSSLTVTPSGGTIAIGASLQLTVIMRDPNGNVVPLGLVAWTSSNSGIATVDAGGRVNAQAQGLATITASTAGIAATAAFTVVAAQVATVAVAPGTATLQLGTTAQFTATTRDAGGIILPGRPVTWSSSNAAVFTVASGGLVTSRGVGTATLTATSEGRSGTALVTVQNVPVVSVQITPSTDTVQIGGQTQLVATPRDASGNPLSGRVITWSNNATAVARLSGSGLIDGLTPGTAVITATSEGQSGTASITVIPVPVAAVIVVPQSVTVQIGATTTFNATPRDANGNALTGRPITWATANSAIAQVSPTGVVSGVALGSVLISATTEGVTGSAFVTVTATPATLVQVTIAPATAALQSGQTQQFTLTGLLSDASSIPVTGSFTASGGAVSGGGLYTAPDQSGTFLVIGTATGTSLRDTASVTVTRPPVATVDVNPATAILDVGRTLSLSAVMRDASGNILTNRTVTWSSNNTALATVTGAGVVTGQGVGTVNITATSEGQTDAAVLTVQITPVATVQVSPASASTEVGAATQLNATTRDANGNVLTGRVVTWTTSNPAAATVNGSGLVTGVAVGNATITATSEGRSATASIAIVYLAVATVQVSPSNATVGIGALQQFTATARDSNGGVLIGRPVTWTSSNVLVGTVTATGQALGLLAGTASIRATVEGVTGSGTLTVTLTPPLGSVPELPSGYTLRATHAGSPLLPSGWLVSSAGTSGVSVIDEPLAPVSPNQTMRVNFPAGYADGNAPVRLEHPSTNGAQQIFYTYWFKYNSTFQGHNSLVNKHIFVFGQNGSVLAYSEMRFSGSATEGHVDFQFQSGMGAPTFDKRLVQHFGGNQLRVAKDQWHRVSLEMIRGSGNGIVRAWVDGVKVGEITNANFVTGIGVVKIDPTWGGNSGDRMTQAGYLYFDEVRLYTR